MRSGVLGTISAGADAFFEELVIWFAFGCGSKITFSEAVDDAAELSSGEVVK